MSTALVWTMWDVLGHGDVKADSEVCDGKMTLAGVTLARLFAELAGGSGPTELAAKCGVSVEAVGCILRTLADAVDHPVVQLVRCVHGALPKMCAFAGCTHFVPDGPREEKWAFAYGWADDDFQAAMHENAIQHARTPGSASPIHLVVKRKMRERVQLDEMVDNDGC